MPYDPMIETFDPRNFWSACRLCGRARPSRRCPECEAEFTMCCTCFFIKGGAVLCADCADGYEQARLWH
jgi:hypothetical protein